MTDTDDAGQTSGLDAIVADLEEDGVHVADGAEGWLSAADEAAIEANVAASPHPVFVVLVPPADERGTGLGDDLAFRIHDATGEDGLYVGVNSVYEGYLPTDDDGRPTTPYVGGDGLQVSAQQWGDVAGSSDVTYDVDAVLGHGDDGAAYELGPGLVVLTSSFADGSFTEVAAEASAARSASVGGSSGGDGVGSEALVVVALLLVVGLAGWGLADRLRRRRLTRAGTPFVLPASVLERVREAGDADAVRRARAAVLALGERIDATDISPTAGARADASWQSALDHYDAATRLLPADGPGGSPDVDVLDAVGALVMAQRGEVALSAAERGSSFTPPVPCFLNPLHGGAVDPRPLEVGGRRVEAPVCRDCRRDLEADRRPDILDVTHRGRPAHYFETDREPWSSTGFGALDPDLLPRLHGRRR